MVVSNRRSIRDLDNAVYNTFISKFTQIRHSEYIALAGEVQI